MLLRLPQIRVSRRCPQSAFPGGDGEARRSSRRRDPRRAYYLDRPCARHGAVLHPGERMALHGWLIIDKPVVPGPTQVRSEEHTSEVQTLMSNSYAVFCLTKQQNKHKKWILR